VTRLKTRRKKSWGLLSSHGSVLFFIASHPGSTRQEIAHGLQLTERSVWALIRDLKGFGAVRSRRDGRRHYYSVDLGTPLWEPLLKGHTIHSIVRDVVRGRSRSYGRHEAA
jgi:arginine repressor